VNEQVSAKNAQVHFYEAFSAGDLDAMMAVWSDDEAIVCIHPGGPPITGLSAVRQSWQQILGTEDLKISASVIQHWSSGEIVTFVVTEHLFVPSRNLHAETLATNAFQKQKSGWKMVLHHGSPKPVESSTTPSRVH